ncbi:MAG: hypothetical protein M5U01_32220 [Ardenticatenaceae bacterium]|nr:hypothetical protein [Ardenticatenaceae bacterium]
MMCDSKKNGLTLHLDRSALTIITRLSRWEVLGLILLPVALWLLWRL